VTRPVPSYAVTWRERGGRARAGKLTLGPSSVRLEAGEPCGSLVRTALRYADIAAAEVVRRPDERIHGRPTVVLRRRSGPPLYVAALNGAGFASELVDEVQTAVAKRAA
jgi:hypothetical protein